MAKGEIIDEAMVAWTDALGKCELHLRHKGVTMPVDGCDCRECEQWRRAKELQSEFFRVWKELDPEGYAREAKSSGD